MADGKILTQKSHVVKGLDPVADAFAGTVRSDVASVRGCHAVTFLVYKGVGATGTSVVTVSACDDFVPTTRTAIPFRSRACTTGDTWGPLTAQTTAGFTTTAGSSQMYAIEVDVDDIEAAAPGFEHVELTLTESVDSPVVGAIVIILHELRHPRAVTATQIA